MQLNNSCIYPAYIRGEAYLAGGQGAAATVGDLLKLGDESAVI